jgi:hypothetical protein
MWSWATTSHTRRRAPPTTNSRPTTSTARLLDLTKDIINVAAVNNFGIDVADIWISDLTPIKAALLPPGRNVIVVSGIDIYANIRVVHLCRGGRVGRRVLCSSQCRSYYIDKVVLADCPDAVDQRQMFRQYVVIYLQ